jgi:hypothetical protein
MHNPALTIAIALASFALLSLPVDAAQGRLKVFILAGQSNMEGHARL